MRKFLYTLTVIGLMMATACSAPQKTIYFSDNTLQNAAVQVDNIERRKEVNILPEDILAIKVSTISSIVEKGGINPVAIFNEGGTAYSISASAGGAGGGAANSAQNLGYLVDVNGFIDYPVIGKLKVSGLTLRQLKDLLADKLKAYVKEPVVEANIINFRVTVFGEVGRVGQIVAANQKISILDAIAAAGDIPITGRKDNVLIIRETEGKREYARLNLNSRTLFSSPYYYLKQNDIVYVEPARIRKQENNDFLKFYLPTIMTILSSVVTIYGITRLTK
ncbi:MAG TPA: polysaccharide biosynthesis/export family protein [Flavipsychrobacter sp.]|nr:polysaccharide biosynthesis/export family protein [Flavipsychrobacter sp.]